MVGALGMAPGGCLDGKSERLDREMVEPAGMGAGDKWTGELGLSAAEVRLALHKSRCITVVFISRRNI